MKMRDLGLRNPVFALPAERMWRVRAVAGAAVALTLAVALAYLHLQTPAADTAEEREMLYHLAELKRLDARQDVRLLRARAEVAQVPAATPEAVAPLTGTASRVAAAAGAARSATLTQGGPALDRALADKARLMSDYLKANAALKQTLDRVMGAEPQIAGLVRGAWRDFPERERLVAVENLVVLLLSEAQEYSYSPGENLRRNIDALLEDLGDAAARLPPALTSGLARLSGDVQALLKAKPVEQSLYEKLAYHPAGPRIDTLAREYALELEATRSARARYQLYVAACGGALMIALAYLALLPLLARRQFTKPRM